MASLALRVVRNVVLAVAAVLVVVVAGFLGYAHYRLRQFGRGLPERFGMHITQESDNVTYSQTVDKRTIFTVHAAKQVEHGDGKYTLHDVGIILYGRKGDRSDRIRGSEFEYDQKQGILRAVGECFIDLAAPAAEVEVGKPQRVARADAGDRMIHVKTSGLVFVQKERSAATDNLVEFTGGGTTGSAVGASYDSAAGVLILRSAVAVSGLRGVKTGAAGSGRPVVLHAGRAELDRDGNLVKLLQAELVTPTREGVETMAAEHAVVRMSGEGTPQRVEAQGRVRLSGDGRGGGQGVVTADRMELDLSASGEPRYGRLLGGVRFVEDTPGGQSAARRAEGHAAEAQVAFDAAGRPVHAVMLGGVEMAERAVGSDRRLTAARVELGLSGGGRERLLLQEAVASGGAALHTVEQRPDRSSRTSDVRADLLTARFAEHAAAKGRPAGTHLAGLDGVGRSFVEQVALGADGAVLAKQTSTGERLKAEFRVGADGKEVLARAEQRGGVNVVREAPGKAVPTTAGKGRPAALEVQHARADVATFDQDRETLVLSGGVEVGDAESALFADRVEDEHGSGDSTAEGAVRVSYLQAGSTGEPVHVLAARAVSHRASGLTEFVAAPGGRVKMWQGGSQVEAPVLDLNRTTKTLVARDEQGADGAVHALLVEAGGAAAKAGGKQASPVRVVSRTMTYLDERREVEFRGHVRVEDGDGVMRADDAVVYLTPAASQVGTAGAAAVPAGATPISLGGRLDHLVVSGAVELEQPGRRATGERLVYTAADRTSVLTGSRGVPPRLVDQTQGTVTGAALRFRSGDDSVVVSGEAGGDVVRVRSETKLKQQH